MSLGTTIPSTHISPSLFVRVAYATHTLVLLQIIVKPLLLGELLLFYEERLHSCIFWLIPSQISWIKKQHWMHHRTSSYAYYCLLKTNWVNSFWVSLYVLTLVIVPSYILFSTSTCLYEFIAFQAPNKRLFLALYHMLYHKQMNIIWTCI